MCSPEHNKARWEGRYLTRHTRENLLSKPFFLEMQSSYWPEGTVDFKVATPRLSQRQLQNRFVFSLSHSDRYNCLYTMTLFSYFKCEPLRAQFILRWCANWSTTFTCLLAANQLTVQNISNFKLVFLVGIGNFCSASYLISNFSANTTSKKRWKMRVSFVTSVLN